MPRRSARLAAKQHGSHQQTAAARTLAIPELLDMVVEQAFTYQDALRFRSVNRLFRDATDARLVQSIHMGVRGTITWPPARLGKTTYRLARILEGPNSKRLAVYVHTADVPEITDPKRLVPFINLVSLTLADRVLDKLAMLFASVPFDLPKLTHLNIGVAPPADSLCPHSQIQSFIYSLSGLTSLYVHLEARHGGVNLPDFGLAELLLGSVHRITHLLLFPTWIDNLRASDLKSLLEIFVNLHDLTLIIEGEDESEDVSRAIPQCIQELDMECDRNTLQRVVRRLADHLWLPALRSVPFLQELGTDEEGDPIDGLATMSAYRVYRALEGLKKRGGVKNIDGHAWRLTSLIAGGSSDYSDADSDSDS